MPRRSLAEEQTWLASVEEGALEPDIDIVDPHHHLWDHITPAYLLDELLADTGAGHRVTQTVFIECGWHWSGGPETTELFAVPETADVAGLAEQAAQRGGAVIAGIVGHADLRLGAGPTGRALDALAEAGRGRFVGIRHATAWDGDPAIEDHRTHPVAGLMGDATFRAGFGELAARNLTYDAWLYHPQIPELTALARAFPATNMVLDHLGGPLGVQSYGGRRDEVLAACRASLTELATCPNVFVKLGGIGMTIMGGGWHRGERPATSEQLAAFWGPHIRWIIETFGPRRCMFESNFPVDRASFSYGVLWNAFKRIAADASPADKAELFAGTARRCYGLPLSG